ncbi:DNA polymerase III subunit beta [Acidithiobacillus thiooxidans]|uniref:DNA polymerase III subunit beta n=1 Tax=Acidithiobacillus thiooxidans TaxID=930 RepID=A0A1C2IQ11_ACITH|nr:nucleotidyltransferase domain-containing protein [Acidithiobacillus thiooxidans]OCX71384.1 DNA polymerase III subunit beta [Acidithiobacillus thiooxidans]OCX73309.1 DNA polymerase III subunit beta [Acidithiobacillus thiooxidans]OCX78058.1 DNA polymerase III subunit beta [Acidithiobacillus thiooxidans]OCX81149.1 DNA polymerase III subunit beta [Acidithiobacillus thiooxidans]OFC41110.1 DNA polymerase III subunit beta [Acidithiobacillus thiooxidans]
MRLSPEQITQIRQSAAESFGPEARVWLFGSRVDDCKRGGDVDLLVESAIPIGNPAFLAAQLSARLQRKMHGRKVDVLLLAPNLRHLPIHDIARSEGCRL